MTTQKRNKPIKTYNMEEENIEKIHLVRTRYGIPASRIIENAVREFDFEQLGEPVETYGNKKKAMGYTLDSDVIEKLDHIKKEKCIPASWFINRAVKYYIDKKFPL